MFRHKTPLQVKKFPRFVTIFWKSVERFNSWMIMICLWGIRASPNFDIFGFADAISDSTSSSSDAQKHLGHVGVAQKRRICPWPPIRYALLEKVGMLISAKIAGYPI